VAVGEPDVRAFLVTSRWHGGGCVIAGWVEISNDVQEVPVASAMVSPQRDAYFAYHYLLFPFGGSCSHSMTVLLYRPGYETVEVSPRSWWQSLGGDRPVSVTWKEAPNLAAQEEALTKIVPDHRGPSFRPAVAKFAAREYARLADSPLAIAPETHERLLARARELEQLAEKGEAAAP
jgi:hypothetical protein